MLAYQKWPFAALLAILFCLAGSSLSDEASSADETFSHESFAIEEERSSNPSDFANDRATLKEILEKDLRARRPQEFAFIAKVIKLINNKTLPLKLVYETFHWARKRPRHPFQYFERALKIRAAKIGVKI